MTQFAAETVIAAHHTSLTDHRTADAHIGRHVDERIGRFNLPRTFTPRGIAGNLRQRSGIGLIAGNRIKSFDHIELFEIQTFPTEIACAQQSQIIGDEPRQCQTGTGKHITLPRKSIFLPQSQFIETGENLLFISIGHVGVNPLLPHNGTVEIEHHHAVAVGVGLQSHAAQATRLDFKRNAGSSIQRLAGWRAFHQNLIVEHQRHQHRHGGFGQAGFLGEIGATHRLGGTQ